MFLVDTNVISSLAPSKAQHDAALIQWLNDASPMLYISAVTAAEIVTGIVKTEREGGHTKASTLRQWWGEIEHFYGERILSFDLQAAHIAGAMLDQARAHAPGFGDVAIAATAQLHSLTVLTGNERHFVPLGVPVLNPFKSLPSLS